MPAHCSSPILPPSAFSVVTAGQTEPSEIGKLQIATFVNPAGLRPIGNNMFTETTASGASSERSV